MRKRLLLYLILMCIATPVYAAPCYGTTMPKQKQLSWGLQTHALFSRYLEGESGKVRSVQNFALLSYGAYDWLSIDLKCGGGNIKQRPTTSDELDYSSSFAGGYGFRLKLYDAKRVRMVFGFQHLSVHPKKTRLGQTRHKAVLDDWQTSLLVSYGFGKFTPYVGLKGSRVDYIHWVEEDRKRLMSDLTKGVGAVWGADFHLSDKIWLNLEGQALDGEAASLSINFSF